MKTLLKLALFAAALAPLALAPETPLAEAKCPAKCQSKTTSKTAAKTTAGSSAKTSPAASESAPAASSASTGSAVITFCEPQNKIIRLDKVYLIPKAEVAAIRKLAGDAYSKSSAFNSAYRAVISAEERVAKQAGRPNQSSSSTRKSPVEAAKERMEKPEAAFNDAKEKLFSAVSEKGKELGADNAKWLLEEKPEYGSYVFYTWTVDRPEKRTSGGITTTTESAGFTLESCGSSKIIYLRGTSGTSVKYITKSETAAPKRH